ncbi:DNA polymerase V subunit UmuC [Hydrogenovibrio sp. SC-1]|uniref:Y-family DNA polymerase n=1 Tax=Hydrogenovibrio sp. SC-1 TaxID=2065820 RepID=UPI000C7DA7AF|nr:Y-family DNA polymerase [Hydrogenovibrio sp. SC-1]PLA74158.1 DNA polymerase V subunit UmuC [Hydrogenovibrio sp. SC-1]
MSSGSHLFALVDGNSFYASCEIAFQPKLARRPVVVLSNNDGCIVAANAVAKSLGEQWMRQRGSLGSGGYRSAVPTNMMFQPYFKIKPLLDRYQAAVFSSNYELYADMSSRMHRLVGHFAPRQEIYSIDESFLDLSGLSHLDLTDYGLQIKQTVQQGIGIPVAVGIAQTKTLAKLANHLAKKQLSQQGVFDLTQFKDETLNALLAQVGVEKIWGIGRQLSKQLKQDHIQTVYDLKIANSKRIRKRYGVVVERTLRELNGESCLALESVRANKQQIICSRSFGIAVQSYQEMESAVVNYVCRAAEKLRQQQSVCNFVTVWVTTNPFDDKRPVYRNQQTIGLIYPSDNSSLLTKLVKRALKQIWVPGLSYQKAGVILSEIATKGALQEDIFAPNPTYSGNPKQAKLMALMDQLNLTSGKNTLFLAAAGMPDKQGWQMKRDLMSPRYTTCWDELLTVR